MKPTNGFALSSWCRAGLWVFTLTVLATALSAATLEYPNHQKLSEQLKRTAAAHGKVLRVTSLVETPGKRAVWLAELGTGTDDARRLRPAMLVVAGIEGNDLAGSVSALAWIEQLAAAYEKEEAIRKLLDSTTIYVLPRLNPDAAERFFAKPRIERATSDLPVDDDHDGLVDEDGPDDLDGDGLITWMRVADAEGEYILDTADPRVLLKADRSKGEKGAWKLFTEGRDDDHDGEFNEDGPGGVNFNRNFPFNYKFFAPWAGKHQVSEVETRALADFVTAHPNIGIIFTFGAADNLVQTPKSEPGGKKPPGLISDEDLPYFRELGKTFREALGLKKELSGAAEPGTFSDWMYFHRGRLSLAARPWTPALQLELAKNPRPKEDGEKKEEKKDEKTEPKKDEKKPASDTRGEEERAALKWFDENAPGAFVPWKEFKHPDFPNQRVEIGGWAPFAKTNPPEKLLEELAKAHAKFLTELAGKLPRIGLRKTEAKPLGDSVYDVTIQVENTGYLPTALAQGALTREVLFTRVVPKLEDKQILSGQKKTMFGPIEGSGGMKELRYIIHATGQARLEFEVISALGGSVAGSVELK